MLEDVFFLDSCTASSRECYVPLAGGVGAAGYNPGAFGVRCEEKIRVFSDLHLEFQDWVPPSSDADTVVLAGDIHIGLLGVEWARRTFPLCPVVYVPGNHEFYGGNLPELRPASFVTLVATCRWSRTRNLILR